MQLRCYQEQGLAVAKQKNTIFVLPTGKGKTEVAAKLIEHFLARFPKKKAAFLVPTQALVEQQSKYCQDRVRKSNGLAPAILPVVGQDQSDWKLTEWKLHGSADIFVGTAECFRKLFVDDKYIPVTEFSVLVFDECHNATGNSPMAAIMRDAVWPLSEDIRPRILGLTASFVNGSTTNLPKKRQKLEALMLSTIFCPDVEPHIERERFIRVSWVTEGQADKADFQKYIDEALRKIGKIKEVEKVVSRCLHVYEELGKSAVLFYVEKVIVDQILVKVQALEEMNDEGPMRSAQSMRGSLPLLRNELERLKENLLTYFTIKPSSPRSNKLEALVKLISNTVKTEQQYRGIVFVEQAALVSALAKELNGALPVSCGAVAGTQYQSSKDRQQQLDQFRDGDIQLLVTTAALEEGIDVPACGVVVRFSKINTTKAHIQGSGRARHVNAKVYYFDNNPDQELADESSMHEAARDRSLSLSPKEIKEASRVVSIPEKHPFPFSADGSSILLGQVNVNNCMQIFCKYCSGILGASVIPGKHLYTFQKTAMGDPRKIIESIRYPTPKGWQTLSRSECLEFFSTVDIDVLFPQDRAMNKTTAEKVELCFVYLVVVRLRQNKYLDDHNGIDGSTTLETRQVCRLNNASSNKISVTNTIYQSS